MDIVYAYRGLDAMVLDLEFTQRDKGWKADARDGGDEQA
jgi:hypothetical protein